MHVQCKGFRGNSIFFFAEKSEQALADFHSFGTKFAVAIVSLTTLVNSMIEVIFKKN